MATRVTVTLPVDQIKEIRKLAGKGRAANVSAFVRHAVHNALQDAKGWREMLAEGLAQTGGPMTAKERAWADSVLGLTKKRRKKSA